MTAVAYPATLPNPTRLIHRPNMRAVISDLPGRPALASKERSYSGAADVEWFFNSAQAAEFYAWWNEALARGGYWFNTSWPAVLPGLNTCQFITDPVFLHVYNGAFKISATLQVRPNSGDLLAPVSGDALYGNVVLLLLGDGAHLDTTFIDSSSYSRTMTPTWYVGTQPQLTNAESVFGTTSIYGGNPGRASGISTPSTGAEWAGEEWCVDGWAKRAIDSDYFGLGFFNNTNLNILMRAPNGGGLWECGLVFDGFMAMYSTTKFDLGVWRHFAVTCQLSGLTSIVRLFMNGVQEASFSRGGNLTTPMYPGTVPNPFSLGQTDSGGGQGITGYVNGFRVTIGSPRWTANFTPPATLAEYAPAS